MYVITADQVGSRTGADAVAKTIEQLTAALAGGLPLPPDRSAGDEVQLLTADAGTALEAILLLTRTGDFSVGLGAGPIREPLGASIRESTGQAFIAARSAVERAKRKPSRFAAAGAPAAGVSDAEALLDLLLLIRARRSAEGWALYELLRQGLTQAAAAERLSITPQAASDRARVADLKAEFVAIEPLTRLLHNLGEEAA